MSSVMFSAADRIILGIFGCVALPAIGGIIWVASEMSAVNTKLGSHDNAMKDQVAKLEALDTTVRDLSTSITRLETSSKNQIAAIQKMGHQDVKGLLYLLADVNEQKMGGCFNIVLWDLPRGVRYQFFPHDLYPTDAGVAAPAPPATFRESRQQIDDQPKPPTLKQSRAIIEDGRKRFVQLVKKLEGGKQLNELTELDPAQLPRFYDDESVIVFKELPVDILPRILTVFSETDYFWRAIPVAGAHTWKLDDVTREVVSAFSTAESEICFAVVANDASKKKSASIRRNKSVPTSYQLNPLVPFPDPHFELKSEVP